MQVQNSLPRGIMKTKVYSVVFIVFLGSCHFCLSHSALSSFLRCAKRLGCDERTWTMGEENAEEIFKQYKATCGE